MNNKDERIVELEAKLAMVAEWKKGGDYVACDSIEELKELSTKKWAELTAILSDTTPPLAVTEAVVIRDNRYGNRILVNQGVVIVDKPAGTKVTVVVMGEWE